MVLSISKLTLAVDGGGVRGYWSLLVLNYLIRQIADIEEGNDQHAPVDVRMSHSFDPERYPPNVSQRISQPERRRRAEAQANGTDEVSVLEANRRYLPCHYFDYICGTSTGA